MQLVNIITEQTEIGFTGRVNILNNESGQFLGAIYFKDGFLVNSLYNSIQGQRSLKALLFDSFVNENRFKYILEPEIVNEDQQLFKISGENVVKNISEDLKRFKENERLKPPGNIKFLVDPDFIISGGNISQEEFKILNIVSDFPAVTDIYDNCNFLSFEVTDALIKLRKKGALKVIGTRK